MVEIISKNENVFNNTGRMIQGYNVENKKNYKENTGLIDIIHIIVVHYKSTITEVSIEESA